MHIAADTLRPRVAVIDYGMGNLRSVLRAWEHVGAEARLVDSQRRLAVRTHWFFRGRALLWMQ